MLQLENLTYQKLKNKILREIKEKEKQTANKKVNEQKRNFEPKPKESNVIVPFIITTIIVLSIFFMMTLISNL
ncbi:MAG: hypothetical protein ACPG5P_04260 [Saprospiraceae bacterium]